MPAPHQSEHFNFNHVAISVPDLEAAAKWYIEVLGCRRIRGDATFTREETPDNAYFRIYPPSMTAFKLAWLSCGNGVGIELYEFIRPKTVVPDSKLLKDGEEGEEFEYARGGFFHIAITVADPEAVGKKVVDNGGKQYGKTAEVWGEKALYAADPWGNIMELISCSLEQLMANR